MKNKSFVTLFVVTLSILIASCSKEKSVVLDDNSQNKSTTIPDKKFVDNFYTKIFTQYPGSPYFTNNSGQYNFTEAGIPGQSSGHGSNGIGFFRTNNADYPLTYGVAYWYEEYRYVIALYSEVPYESGESKIINIAGLNIASLQPNEITPGYYPYSNSSELGTLNMAYVGFDVTNLDPQEYLWANSGSLNISVQPYNYDLYFNGTLENGHSLIISFTGQLEIVVIEQ